MNTKEKNFFGVLLIIFAIIIIMPLKSNANSTNVSTKEEFIEAVENSNDDINVIADIDLTGAGVLNVTGRTINLNGHTIMANNFSLIFEGENFTIKNGTFDAKGGSYALFIGDAATNNVIIENITTIGGINIYNTSNVVIRNVDVRGADYYAIWCDWGGQATVKSGSFITDGVAVLGRSASTNALLKIEGGTFTANDKSLVLKSGGKPEISGGSFDVPVDEEYCAEGFEPIEYSDNSYGVCNHANTMLKDMKEATCTSDGYTGDTYCSNCNKSMGNGEIIYAIGHKMTHHDAVPATCINSEIVEHWNCENCNKNFLDEEGTQELTSLEGNPALGHTPSEWKFDNESHWQECIIEGCGVIIPESKASHNDLGKDGECNICCYKPEGVEEPEDPTIPEEPENPDEPNKPEVPVEPEKPDEPNKPEEPGAPVEPEKPDKPNKPEVPVEPEKPEEKPAIKNVIDSKTNIRMEFDEGVVTGNVDLKVNEILEGETYNNIKNVLPSVEKFIAFDINLISNGVKVQPNGKVKVNIPLPTDFDETRLIVYRIEGKDKIEYEVKVIVIDNINYAQFETDHFSNYVLAEKSHETTIPTEKEENTPNEIVKPGEEEIKQEISKSEHELDNEPKTGVIGTAIFTGVALIVSITGYIICKKKMYK